MLFRIREARELCGLTQAALADMLGISGVTLSGYETGKHDPKSDTLAKIANICCVSVDFLLGLEERKEQEISPEALAVARAYDQMSGYGKSMIDKIVENEKAYKVVKAVPVVEMGDPTKLMVDYLHAKRQKEMDQMVENYENQLEAAFDMLKNEENNPAP